MPITCSYQLLPNLQITSNGSYSYASKHSTTVQGKCFKGENFCSCAQNAWKTFVMHQAEAIIYRTQEMIQRENFRSWLKNGKNRKSFSPRIIYRVRYMHSLNPTSSCGFLAYNTKLMP